MDAKDDQQHFGAMFRHLIESLNEAAMVQMGKLANPETGRVESNLALARNTIDLLRMLREKTLNNLTEGEARLIEQSILNLQLSYVSAAAPKSDAEENSQAPEEAAGSKNDSHAAEDNDLPPGSRPGENN